MTKRILREMRIMELSAVDNPAQEGATFVLAKRAKEGDYDTMAAKPDDKPKPGSCTCDKPTPKDGKCQKCGKPMGKGLTPPGDDDANSGDDHTKSGEGSMTDAEKLAAVEAELAVEKAKGEKLAKVATLSDVEKSHYEGLVALDAEGADKFLDASKQDRAVEIEKALNADPVIYTDTEGHEYHKSEAKAAHLAKRADELEKANRELRAAGEDAEIAKRAEMFKNLKGEMPVKVALLKAVETIKDETIRTAVTELLKANDAGIGEAMKTLGTKNGPVKSEPEAKLNKMAEDYAEAKKVSFAKAFDAVVLSEEGKALYAEMYNATLPKAAV